MALNFGQNLFPMRAGRVIQSYNYLDLAEGTGTVKYQLCNTTDSVAEDRNIIAHSLITDMFSDELESSGTGVAELAFTKVMDIDFDMSVFNYPRSIRGRTYFQFEWGANRTAGGSAAEAYVIIKVKNGATLIASVQTETQSFDSDDYAGHAVMLYVDISTTHFKKGEQLRITAEGWSKGDGNDNYKIKIHHDPNTSGKEFFAWIPYHIRT